MPHYMEAGGGAPGGAGITPAGVGTGESVETPMVSQMEDFTSSRAFVRTWASR